MSDLDVDELVERRRESETLFGAVFDCRKSPVVSRTQAEEESAQAEWTRKRSRPMEPVSVQPGRAVKGIFYIQSKSPVRKTRSGYMFKLEVENNDRLYPLACMDSDRDYIMHLYRSISLHGHIELRGAGNLFYGRTEVVVRRPAGRILRVD